jgi:hypothetical protein
VTIVPLAGTTYYLAPAAAGGNDSNNGLSPSSPWLSPNHSVKCGDVIIGAASTEYNAANFGWEKWGTVTCSAGNNVAWLECATFDACKIIGLASAQTGMVIGQSYWGVQGWEVDGAADSAACFWVVPNSGVTIHHIIFANDIASGCGVNGFSTSQQNPVVGSPASVDYLALVGNIAYNDAKGTKGCGSGIIVYEPLASDSLPGTHIYIAGNFSYHNFDADPCSGGIPSDGEGIDIDTFDGSQTGNGTYSQQAVIDNNILIANGGRGLQVFNNAAGKGPFAHIYFRSNTVWGNNGDLNQNQQNGCGEIVISVADNIDEFLNLAATNATDGCGHYPIHAFSATGSPTTTDQVYQNWGYAVGGTTTDITGSSGFSYGPNNTFGTNPAFVNPVVPGAPNCGGYTSVPACMATVITNFTPTNPAAMGFGYQVPSSIPAYDPLFPQWLCNVNLPVGLIARGCQIVQ